MEKIVLKRTLHKGDWFGFYVKPNYLIGVDCDTLIASSGWVVEEDMCVYYLNRITGEWERKWWWIGNVEIRNGAYRFKGDLSKVRKVKR